MTHPHMPPEQPTLDTTHLIAEEEERRIVGACIGNQARRCIGLVTVEPSMFTNAILANMMREILAMYAGDNPITSMTVARALADKGADFGKTFQALMMLESEGAFDLTIESFCDTVRNRYCRRNALSALTRAARAVEAGDDDQASNSTSEAIAALGGVFSASDEPVSIGAAAAAAFATAEDARKNGRKPGIQISLRLWNQVLGGLKSPRLIIVGARPGAGKSALVAQIAMDVARQGYGVLFWSGEMNHEEIGNRRLASDSGVSAKRIDQADYTESQSLQIMTAAAALEGVPMWIDDRPSLQVRDVESRARWVAARVPKGIGLVVIDYVQLMKAAGRHGSREQAVAEVSRNLKGMAKALGCCVLAAAQLNRECEKRADHEPIISDLRESGQIEQDADTILFLYRASMYDANADPKRAQLFARKNRGGTCGEIPLRWDGPTQTFVDGEYENRDFMSQ